MGQVQEQDSRFELIDQRAAARLLQVSPRTLETWRHRGGGPPYIKVSKSVRYSTLDLFEWLEGQKRASTSRIV